MRTSDSGLKDQGWLVGVGGWEVGLGARSQEQGSTASCGGHIWRLPRLTSRVHLVLGWRKRALMRGSCARAAGSHLFCFQHQRPGKRLSSPEGHGHPSWRLHCQEARSPRPAPVRSMRGTPTPPLPSTISQLWLCRRPLCPSHHPHLRLGSSLPGDISHLRERGALERRRGRSFQGRG